MDAIYGYYRTKERIVFAEQYKLKANGITNQ